MLDLSPSPYQCGLCTMPREAEEASSSHCPARVFVPNTPLLGYVSAVDMPPQAQRLPGCKPRGELPSRQQSFPRALLVY